MNLNIIVKGNNNQKFTLFLNDEVLGTFSNNYSKEIQVSNSINHLYFEYNGKKSNVFKLDSKDENYQLEIDKAFKMSQIPPTIILRILIPLLMMSFCFHMAFGIGFYVFGIVSLLLIVLTLLNKNKLFIRKLQE